jgi:hypothetical protein
MNNTEKKTENVNYSSFGIEVIPKQSVEGKKHENISALKNELLNKQYGIEILENSESHTDNQEVDFSSEKTHADTEIKEEENIYK